MADGEVTKPKPCFTSHTVLAGKMELHCLIYPEATNPDIQSMLEELDRLVEAFLTDPEQDKQIRECFSGPPMRYNFKCTQ